MVETSHIFSVPDEYINKKIDADRSKYAYEELYDKFYFTNDFWRKEKEIKVSSYGIFSYQKCMHSGDTVFNFGIGIKAKAKFESFYNLLKLCPDSEYYLNKLVKCAYANYSLNNFAIKPCTGGMSGSN